MPDRGPDPRQLALDRHTRAVLAFYQLENELERVLSELREAAAKVEEQDMTPAEPRARTRAMAQAWNTYCGVAFWDREPAEPASLRAS